MKMTADDYLKAGNENFSRKEFTEAINNCDKAIKLDPSNAYAHYLRGTCKGRCGLNKEAIEDYNRAIILDPHHASSYINRGNAKNNLRQHVAAIDDYDKAIILEPWDAFFYYNRGIAKHTIKKYAPAKADFDKAIELGMGLEQYKAYCDRGAAKACLEEDKDAIADYDQAIKLKPDYAIAYGNRGQSNSRLKQYNEAIADYDQALRIDPKGLPPIYNRGCALQRIGELDKAKTDFLKLIEMTREDPQGSLYKYIPINPVQLLSLINGKIYFARLSQLNDPLECFFLNKGSAMGECFQQNEIEPRICSMVQHSPGEGTAGSTLLFAHYADEHKGICVEYEINFKQIDNNTKVSYGGVLYEQKDELYDLRDLYMLKDPAWEYEDEFRLVRFDNEKFAAAKVNSITFGLKCPQAHRNIVRYLLPEGVEYHEMAYKGVGNKIINQSVSWQSKKISSEEAFKLMLSEDLVHLNTLPPEHA